jgi:hypothetical protein
MIETRMLAPPAQLDAAERFGRRPFANSHGVTYRVFGPLLKNGEAVADGGSGESLAGADTDFLENDRQRAEPGERRLEKVYADEGGQPQPVLIMDDGQTKACQNDKTGES